MQRVASNDRGFILVAVLVILMLLVVIGISATTTTTVELQIAGNDKVSKKTFYGADGGTELGSRMVEENVGCPNGFTATTVGTIRGWTLLRFLSGKIRRQKTQSRMLRGICFIRKITSGASPIPIFPLAARPNTFRAVPSR